MLAEKLERGSCNARLGALEMQMMTAWQALDTEIRKRWEQIDERRAAARFEPTPDAEGFTEPRDYEDVLADASAGADRAPSRPQSQPQSQTPQAEQDTYTERLLAAKKKAKKDL